MSRNKRRRYKFPLDRDATPRATTCRSPGKRNQFATVEAAKDKATWLEVRRGVPFFVYQCDCGWLHLSRRRGTKDL